ncbi:hypothetical protein PI124_g20717 [Phytophthora idaei]|nr:hypothetical protein PI125_g20678 [Phytophthora idaei]KAG3130629.1 hypothetical protein PI126_g20418 [Phytophthora idaei]KAG3234227.1 hypothetical protein PI124_g20717 [Phytophthora idaei]
MHGTPSLAPELWNLSAVILLCGLMGWMMRLVRLTVVYLEVRFAIQQSAVIHLEKLGPSLHVLQHVSMWHFHQLLRTQLQVASTTMKRVRIPFEIVASSVKLVEAAGEQQQPRMNLSVEVKAETKCVVQMFWNVKTSALEGAYQSATDPRVDWPTKRRFHLVDAVPTRAARSAIHAMRSLPGKFYDADLVKTPHQLLDDDDNGIAPSSPKTGLCLARHFVGSDSFRACSVMEKRKNGGVDEYVASIPSDLLAIADPEEAIQSSVVATDCEHEDTAAPPLDPHMDDSRYACVIAIGSTDFFNYVAKPKSPGIGLRRRLSSRLQDEAEDEIVCQCVAIDFLPTPAKLSRVPVIVKKLNYTATDVFSSQEIFGRESGPNGECVICLERPQAAILLPCRHFCVCRECLEEIDQCPICRAKFSTYVCYQSDDSSRSSAHHIQLQVMLMGAYEALAVTQSAQLYLLVGILGFVVYLLLVLSFFLVPNIKAQHPAADLVVWHAGCGLVMSAGFIFAFALQRQDVAPEDDELIHWQCSILGPFNQFFLLAGVCWYLMLSLDLLVALVNPWMGYSCKSWAYHTIVWSVSAVSALLLHQLQLYGLSPLNVCWVKRTKDPMQVNTASWVFLFAIVGATCVLSFAVLLFASFRFVRRQLDVTYRAKRRNLMQYYRYLLIFAGHWAACAALYYAAYLQEFDGKMAKHFELAFALVFGSYPVLLLIVWVLNTELYQNFSSENNLSKSERGAGDLTSTEHFSAALRKDLMRYTTAGIRCSISLSFLQMEEGDSAGLYHEKKRLATTVYNGEYRYYEKLGFTDYAPKVFQNIREICGIDNEMYEQSFADTLLERASEGKSGMLFYFTSDRKYLVKTMTKKEHSFLLEVLPLFHQYILKQPNSLLCRFLGCHSMQLPVGWNKMFFVVMENIFPDGPVDERYDLKGIFHQSNFRYQEGIPTPVSSDWSRSGRDEEGIALDEDEGMSSESQSVDSELGQVTEKQPLLRRGSSRPSLRYDNDFVIRRASLRVNPTTRANLLAQVTSDCGFLQELGIMDYSCLLGIRHYNRRIEPDIMNTLAHNAVVSADQSTVYYLGFVDILQHYNIGWKMQHCLLAAVVDKRQITALPPAEYALRFLNFIHEYLLRDPEGSHVRSYGSIGYSPSSFIR